MTYPDYVDCLKEANEKHLEIVLSPDHVWFTLMCEVARLVEADPERYRSHFTTRPQGSDKIAIRIKTDKPQDLTTYIDRIIDQLRVLLPSNLATRALIDFSTITPTTLLAQHAAFADMAKSYYSYCGCQGAQGYHPPPKPGIAKVHLMGTPDDWAKIRLYWVEMAERLFDPNPSPELADYRYRVETVLGQLAVIARWQSRGRSGKPFEEGQEFLKLIYDETLHHNGWFMQLYVPTRLKQPGGSQGSIKTFQNVARVPYEAEFRDGSKKKYTLIVGVLWKKLDGKMLVPEFGHEILEGLVDVDFPTT